MFREMRRFKQQIPNEKRLSPGMLSGTGHRAYDRETCE